jgi:predicted nucleotidyltransferase
MLHPSRQLPRGAETIARNNVPCRQKAAVRRACRPHNDRQCSNGRTHLPFIGHLAERACEASHGGKGAEILPGCRPLLADMSGRTYDWNSSLQPDPDAHRGLPAYGRGSKGTQMPELANSMPSLIQRITTRIVKRFHPEKVILFGSQARGNITADSDLDLLVVMDFEGSKLDKMVEVREVLNGINVPTDILITTPDDFAWRKDVVGTIEWPAFHEGKILYARA